MKASRANQLNTYIPTHEEFMAMLQKKLDEVRANPDPKKAKAIFIELGILDSDGKLTEPYRELQERKDAEALAKQKLA